MKGRLGIDFGNANTVLSTWDGGAAYPLTLEPFSKLHTWQNEQIPIVPSIIHYRENGTFLIGEEVLDEGLEVHPNTFISLKTTFDTLHAIQIGERKITAKQAAEDFLSTILKKAKEQIAIKDDEFIAFSVPVDTFEKYSKWLSDIASNAGFTRVRFIDEPAAAALCLGKTIKQNDDYLILDFGAGSLDVAVVRFNPEKKSANGGHCKILGKQSMQLGGNNIDDWLVRHLFDKIPSAQREKEQRWLLRKECRAAKEKLSFEETATITLTNYTTGKATSTHLSRLDFVSILESNDFFAKIHRTIGGAERTATYHHAYKPARLAGFIMVGGTSIIPELQKQLRLTHGKDKVEISRPLDSISYGAAMFASGASLFDHIQHDYAIQVRNIKAQKTQMKVIIQRGEKYPSEKPIASETIKAVTYGQTKFQILIYEISKEEVEPGSEFIDLAQTSIQDDQVLRYVCLNKSQPTLLETKRPVMKDQPAMQIDFRLDENKHLLVDTYVFETPSKKVVHREGVAVVRLV